MQCLVIAITNGSYHVTVSVTALTGCEMSKRDIDYGIGKREGISLNPK